jgi:hypothetical protein
MRIDAYEFGRITIDGVVYDHDVVIEGGRVRKRKKGPSKKRREASGHTPLTADEETRGVASGSGSGRAPTEASR